MVISTIPFDIHLCSLGDDAIIIEVAVTDASGVDSTYVLDVNQDHDKLQGATFIPETGTSTVPTLTITSITSCLICHLSDEEVRGLLVTNGTSNTWTKCIPCQHQHFNFSYHHRYYHCWSFSQQ
jgi:hypothetical protein